MSRARQPTSRQVAFLCALVAVVAGLLAIVATSYGWPDPSLLVRLSVVDPLSLLATHVDPDFALVPRQAHYDGLYYYAIALDPFANGQAHTLIDQAAYRYSRPMHGWLAALLSGGRFQYVPEAMLALSMLGLALGGYAASRLSVAFGRTPWGGLLIAMSPGLLFATTSSTTEPMGTALAIVLVLAWLARAHPVVLAALSVVMSLYREQLILVIGGILLYEVVSRLRRRDVAQPPGRARVVALLVGPLALAAWVVYLHARFDEWPRPTEAGSTSLPGVGWVETFRYALFLQQQGGTAESQIGTTAPSFLIALAVLLLAALWASRRVRTVLEGVLVAEVAAMSLLGWRTLVYPHEMYRIPTLAVLVAIAVLLLRSRPASAHEPAVPHDGTDVGEARDLVDDDAQPGGPGVV